MDLECFVLATKCGWIMALYMKHPWSSFHLLFAHIAQRQKVAIFHFLVKKVTLSSALAVSQGREHEHWLSNLDFPVVCGEWYQSDIEEVRKKETKIWETALSYEWGLDSFFDSQRSQANRAGAPWYACHPGEHFLPCTSFPPHFTSSPPSSPSSVSYILFVLAIISSLCTSLASWRLMNFLSLRIQWLLW